MDTKAGKEESGVRRGDGATIDCWEITPSPDWVVSSCCCCGKMSRMEKVNRTNGYVAKMKSKSRFKSREYLPTERFYEKYQISTRERALMTKLVRGCRRISTGEVGSSRLARHTARSAQARDQLGTQNDVWLRVVTSGESVALAKTFKPPGGTSGPACVHQFPSSRFHPTRPA